MEFVSEKKHVSNLFYWRDLLKLELDDLTEKKKNGELVSNDDPMELIMNISIIDDCIATLPSKVKELEENEIRKIQSD